MSNQTQTDIAWSMAEQTGRLVGKWGKNGIEYFDLPSFEELKTAEGYLKAHPEKRYRPEVNPKLVSSPSYKELSNKHYRQEVESYAKHWRGVMKERSKPQGTRGVTYGRTVGV